MHVRIDCFQSGHTKADYGTLRTLLKAHTIECEVNDKTQSTINDSVVCRITGGSEEDRNSLQPRIEETVRNWLGNKYTNIIFRCSGAPQPAPQ